jgi:hypothetical protein
MGDGVLRPSSLLRLHSAQGVTGWMVHKMEKSQ